MSLPCACVSQCANCQYFSRFVAQTHRSDSFRASAHAGQPANHELARLRSVWNGKNGRSPNGLGYPATVGLTARLRPFSRTAPPTTLAASFGLRRGADAAPAPGVRAGPLVLGAHPKTLEVGRFAHTLPLPFITAQMRRASWADSGADGCGVKNVRVGPRTRRFAGWGLWRGPP